ncbi:hypothetical protein BaRGS_00006843 [Batillaria attramentaria]|uniref:Uncharacterized protein n=1 Tax=Batillaria attramentaria TaxID=370345 RepID=A0ABD0LRH8_9CAEN
MNCTESDRLTAGPKTGIVGARVRHTDRMTTTTKASVHYRTPHQQTKLQHCLRILNEEFKAICNPCSVRAPSHHSSGVTKHALPSSFGFAGTLIKSRRVHKHDTGCSVNAFECYMVPVKDQARLAHVLNSR